MNEHLRATITMENGKIKVQLDELEPALAVSILLSVAGELYLQLPDDKKIISNGTLNLAVQIDPKTRHLATVFAEMFNQALSGAELNN